MKIYTNKINESWIIDRVIDEWKSHNDEITSKSIEDADIVWIISNWTWKKIRIKYLKEKKVVASIYHIDFDNFNKKDEKNFYKMDQYVDLYHVISLKTKEQLKRLTNKKITSIPFWVNQKNLFYIENKSSLRKKYGFSEDDYIIGSFQRDTEGSDLVSPKLIKGPDIFIDLVNRLNNNQNIRILLAGTRRQYVINKLKELGINYKYFEMVQIDQLNEFYNILDLYLVSSRLEGGPQAVLECAVTKTPIISTDVGVASEILHPNSIYSLETFENAKPMVEYAYENSKKYTLPDGMKNFINMFRDIYES
tara:strand:- start:4430 stop:5350 length:921 start_codon:yes stop_codon:yes gene_type:complete